jgi:hypothetical protein
MSFIITNNLLTPNTKARPKDIPTCNNNLENFENPKDGSFGMKHLKSCSYTIPKNPSKDKWGAVAKA